VSSDRNLLFAEVEVGAAVPPYAVELTMQRLVMEAGANRDFAPSHFDRELVRTEGREDVFANTMLLQTMFEVMLRGWMGPAGRIRKLGFRMHDVNYVDQTLSAHGVVTRCIEGPHSGSVELDIWLQTRAQGKTTSGKAVVELPNRRR
jgi:acyl dehydratase